MNIRDTLHADVADVAVQVLNDMSVNSSVKCCQMAITTSQLRQHSTVGRVD